MVESFNAAWRMFEAGNRSLALVEIRKSIARYPNTARGYRYLSFILTHNERYRHEPDLCRSLVDDGSVTEALAAARTACGRADAQWIDFLQVGYCLTALKHYDEATQFIRIGTDMFSASREPGLFAGMNESWQPLTPAFLIIGVAKASTTSLYHSISQHPRVLPPVTKEVDFFGSPARGFGWYLAHFPRRPSWENRFITGEARVGNFDNPNSPELVKQFLPNAKLIALLRDPVERALSHYYNDLKLGAERRPLDDAMDDELSFLDRPAEEADDRLGEYLRSQRHYLYLGLYTLHLRRWLEHCDPKDLLIVVSEELNADPKRQLSRIFKHIGLKYQSGLNHSNRFPGTYDDQPKERVRAKLENFFRSPNERLYEMLGRRLGWREGGVSLPT